MASESFEIRYEPVAQFDTALYLLGMDDQNFYVTRSLWLDHILIRQDMTHGAFRVAYFIASKINPDSECMWWSVAKIAKEMGMSLATVTGAVDALQHVGLLVVTKGRFGSHRYFMRMPFDPEGAEISALKNKRKKTGGRKLRVSKIETKPVSKNET